MSGKADREGSRERAQMPGAPPHQLLEALQDERVRALVEQWRAKLADARRSIPGGVPQRPERTLRPDPEGGPQAAHVLRSDVAYAASAPASRQTDAASQSVSSEAGIGRVRW